MSRRWRNTADRSPVNDAFQVDLVVALFAVLLIYLMFATQMMGQTDDSTVRISYSTEEAESDPFMLRSLAVPFPYRRLWIAREGMLFELDLEALAREYARQDDPEWEGTVEGLDLWVRPLPGAVESHAYRIAPYQRELPEALTLEAHALSDLDAALGAMQDHGDGHMIVIWRDQTNAIAPLLAALRDAGEPHDTFVLKQDQVNFWVTHETETYAMDSILRTY